MGTQEHQAILNAGATASAVVAAENPPRTALRSVLLLGFSMMVGLMALSWAMFLAQLDQVYSASTAARLAGEKMEVIAILIETARKRTRLATELTLQEDPFERDETSVKLDNEAANFAKGRDWLLATKLSDAERTLIDELGKLTAPALAKQREASEMSLSDDPKQRFEAQKIVMFEVLPMQGRIIDKFMELFHYQRKAIDGANDRAEQDYRHALRLGGILVVVSAILAVSIALFVIRRTVRIERDLSNEKIRLETTLRGIGDAVVSVDRHLRVDYMNPAAERLTGTVLAVAAGRPLGKVLDARDEFYENAIDEIVAALIADGTLPPLSQDIRLHRRSGERYWIDLRLSPVADAQGEVRGAILSFHDDTAARQRAQQIEQQARTDALTDLFNRHAFEERVSDAMALYAREGPHVLCAIDLDHFKPVNDTCGHAAGDELLRKLAQLFRSTVRRGDFVARIGGDEFAIFLANTSASTAQPIANEILDRLRQYRFNWEGKVFCVGASIGLVETPKDVVTDYAALLQAADAACYDAKSQGRDRVVIRPFNQATR